MIEYDPKNWVRICFALHGSVAPRLLPRVALAGAIGFGAQWAQERHGFTIPPLAHTLIGVALGLLLVFRTNASYGRYVRRARCSGVRSTQRVISDGSSPR
ncbi:MAG TPA: bestrophin family ion channel [Nannocystaceae bacterium]|nr:bestrophin family ion channel [Nannocystaceae bacterium]